MEIYMCSRNIGESVNVSKYNSREQGNFYCLQQGQQQQQHIDQFLPRHPHISCYTRRIYFYQEITHHMAKTSTLSTSNQTPCLIFCRTISSLSHINTVAAPIGPAINVQTPILAINFILEAPTRFPSPASISRI